MLSGAARTAYRVGVGAVCLLAYAAAHLTLFPLFAGAVTALALLPVLLAGWLGGTRVGIVVAALALPTPPIAHALMGTPYTLGITPIGYALVFVVLVAAGGTVGRLRDLSDRLAAQSRAHEASEARFRELFDYAPVGYHELDLHGRVTRVNRTELLMLGYDEAEMLGRPIFDFIAAVETAEARARYRAKVEGRVELRPFERTYRRKDGTPVPLLLEDRLIRDADGAVVGLRTTLQDISAQHEAQEKLREADRMKTEFVSLVSHELRTPLTSIKGYVDLLLDGEGGDLTPDQDEFLGIVKNNADRLVALIDDLLDVSRIEAGKIELTRQPVAPERLVASVAASLRPQIAEKGQSLLLDLPEALPAVYADEQRVTQALANLLSNAHKYTPAGGKITVAASVEQEMLRIAVSDTGIGLTPDEQAKLFTKFFRAKNRATQEVGGTGLGLAITKSLVELHGGAMSVTSVPGEGSTFAFTLPLADAPAAEAAPAPNGAAGASTRYHGARILVVEDEPDIAQLIARYLERGGYAVDQAPDGSEALRIAQSQPPALITLDVMLPGPDGFTVLEWLKSNPATANIPVLMVSMLPDDGRGRLLGAVDYLAKPVGEDVLLRRVGAALDGATGRRVLVADDDAGVRAILAGHLRRAGHHVIEAEDGESALRLAERERPDLVLLDVRMPGMDGVQTLRALRASAFGQAMPVLMMTASPGVADENRGAVAELGSELVTKPSSAEELVAAIARALP